jgi:hypothetical protein
MNKQCFTCRETKPISDFYTHPAMADGHLGKCKTCTKRDVSERSGRLGNNPVWLAKERHRCRIKQARYRRLGVAILPSKETRQKWEQKNGHKRKAEQMATYAQKRGVIKKPDACQRCGATGVELEKHHPDYSKPLEVQWLCTICHGKTRHKDEYIDVPIP